MSLFGNNSSNFGGRRSNVFRDTGKIVYITKIVTQTVTNNISGDGSLIYDKMYNDVGPTIINIFDAFVTGSEDLKILIDYENYNLLADKLYSHLNHKDENFENFRNLIVGAVEGIKHCDNKIKEQEHAYLTLLYAYNSVVENSGPDALLLEAEASMAVTAQIKDEIVEYIRRGYQIVDDEGNLIPIDIDILAQIREDLNLN